MSNPFVGIRSAWLEFRNFRASGWLMFTICAVALIPFIYAGLFLLAFLDPYGSLVNVPAAVVNLDEGAVIDDEDRNLGQELCDQLVENNEDRTEGQATGFNWQFVGQDDADEGLRSAKYYMELVIPENFSQTIADADSDNPQQAELNAYFNPSTNLIAQTVGSSMVTKIKAELDSKISNEYFDTIFVSLSEASDELLDAVDGSKELADGLGDAQDGADSLSDGLDQLHDGSATLTEGLADAKKGANSLSEGGKSISDGADQLYSGLVSAQQGSQTITDNLGTLSDGADSVSSGVQQVGAALAQLAAAVNAPSSSETGPTELGAAIQKVASDLQNKDLSAAVADSAKVKAAAPQIGNDLSSYVGELASAAVTYQKDGAAAQSAAANAKSVGAEASTAAGNLQSSIAKVQGGDISAGSVTGLAKNAGAFLVAFQNYNSAMTKVTDSLTTLQSSAAAYNTAAGKCTGYLTGVSNTSEYASSTMSKELVAAINQLNIAVNVGTDTTPSLASGAKSVASGASQLETGSQNLTDGLTTAVGGTSALSKGGETLANGAKKLSAGISTAADGSKKITYNLATAADGASDLAEGLTDAVDGAGELHDGLVDGQKELADNSKNGTAKADMMAEPIKTNGENGTGESITTVQNYGTGFAPYFIALGMWVGCLMITFTMRTMNNRLLMSRASSVSAVLSSYIPMLGIAFIQVIILLAFIQFGLGFSVNFPLEYYLFGFLVAACFAAIAQFFRASMGSAGLVVLVVLLMLQLCTAAGTFPIEAELPIFNWLNPFLPMTYVVQGFRMAMCGLSTDLMLHSAIALALFTAGFLFLSTVYARYRRRVTMNVLYPKIQLAH